ncbi:MAG: sigma-70 family RNA polymerase sigma factor [Planctomycetaceae bacterium]|nr:sigma-70 family RNA polymerase sigma factor [Planctomycetaceae bacterium]
MMTAPETRPSLLLRLRDTHDQRAWAEFWEMYQPLILRLVRQKGLQDADAREVTQEVLVSVAGAIGRWEADPARGSFRGWLATITRNLVVNFLIRQARHPRGTGNSDFIRWLDEVPSPDCGESQLFDLEHRRQVFLWAASEIETEFRSETWRAFWETSVTGRTVVEVSEELKMSAGAVYVARSRVMKRLREKVEEFRE